MSRFTNALGLDVGERRIGIARVNSIAQIAEPLVVLINDSYFRNKLEALIAQYSIDIIVVGLPRNMQGEKTKQTESVEKFVNNNLNAIGVPIIFQDETLSTVVAKSKSNLPKDMEDAVAAGVILDYFINEQKI